MDSLSSPDANERAVSAVDFEAPPMVRFDERRMHVRAYNYWTSLLGERPLPSIEDLDPEAIEDFGSHSILLDFTTGVANPAIAFVGSALMEECGIGPDVGYVNNVPPRTLISRLTDHYLQIIANCAPIGFEAEFTNQRDAEIMYRGILMPFSSDGDTIDFIYGVINWKEVASNLLTDSIAAEVDAVMRDMARETGDIIRVSDDPHRMGRDMIVPDRSDAETAGAPRPLDDDAVMDLGAVAFNADEADLTDWLARAREQADLARQSEGRTRVALYEAIGAAYDLALAAQAEPEAYAEMLAEAGIVAHPRSPLTAIAKLSFGADYDKTRIAEYALIIDDAINRAVPMGTLALELGQQKGGLKALIGAIRAHRRDMAPPPKPRSLTARRKAAQRPAMPSEDIMTAQDGLAVVIARRDADGTLSIVAALPVEDRLNDRVMARALR